MLKLFYRLSEMDFSQLMGLYLEGNTENAHYFYPYEEIQVGILRAEQDFYRYLKEGFFGAKGACYAIWEENGRYLSALRLEPYKDGLLLEALETHPEHRRRGYAKALIHAVATHPEIAACGKIYSHVGKYNTPSLKTHFACGFRRIAENAVYIDGSVSDRACTLCLEQK